MIMLLSSPMRRETRDGCNGYGICCTHEFQEGILHMAEAAMESCADTGCVIIYVARCAGLQK